MKQFLINFILILVFYTVEGNAQAILPMDSLCKIEGVITLKDKPVRARVYYTQMPDRSGLGLTSSDPKTGRYKILLKRNAKYTIRIETENAFNKQFSLSNEELSKGKYSRSVTLNSNEKEALLTLDLLFESGTNIIDENYTEDLDALADEMKKNLLYKIRLEGHTDFRGSKKANLALGKERVIAVKNYLVKAGVKGSKIKLKSFGGSKPITHDPEKKEKNRRVEIRILSN